jgi:type III secretion system YscD/HrpQ family protein
MAETFKSRTVRVVQGLQEGAEFSLDSGLPCVIGSDPSCTAVLLDENVAPRHCLLSIEDRSVRCTALDDAVRIGASTLAPGATARIFDYQTIEIGDASFAVRPADEEWEKGLARAGSLLARFSPGGRLRSPRRLLGSAFLVVIGFAASLSLAYAMMSPDRTEMTEARTREARQWLKSIAPVGSELQLEVDSDHHLSVSGYVNTIYQRDLLAMSLHDSEYQARSDIHATEEIVAAVARLARLEGISCLAKDAGAGIVSCANEVDTPEAASKLTSLAQQVPGLKALNVQVKKGEPIAPPAQEVAEAVPPAASAVVAMAPTVAPLRMSRRFSSILILKKNKWLIGAYGEKFAEGDEFNGIRIVKIELDQVEFQKGDRHYVFPLAALQ